MIRTVACLLLTLCSCVASHAQTRTIGGVEVPQARVVGGTNAPEGAYRWMASVGTRSGGSNDIFFNQFCGGMLVSQDYVLTAAHCVVNDDPSDLEIVVGVTNLGNVPSTARRRDVTEIIIHPEFRESLFGQIFNDVALLKLDRPITDITPIPIATSPTTTAGTVVKAIGWGDTTDSEFTVSFPRALQQVELQTVSLNQLRIDYGNSISLQHLGASANGRDTCQGDSGGPLFTESPLSLVGITSFGIGCADSAAGVYADVGFFSDYINSIIVVEETFLLGDVNIDGSVDFFDITPFIEVLTGGEYQDEADTDQNGVVNFLDIAPFIALLR